MFLLVLVVIVGVGRVIETTTEGKDDSITQGFLFQDFINKYSPKTVKENIHEARKQGIDITKDQESEIMIDSIDATDEILGFSVESLPFDKKSVPQRRWGKNESFFMHNAYIPTGIPDNKHREKQYIFEKLYDPYESRIRLFALIQQAIYQARDKMTIMQKLRKMYRDNSLYKMGFLFSKTDQAAKTLSSYYTQAYRALSARISYSKVHAKLFEIYGMIELQERLQNLWFDVDLLVDLINWNDDKCKEMLKRYQVDRKTKEWFDDYDGKRDWPSTSAAPTRKSPGNK